MTTKRIISTAGLLLMQLAQAWLWSAEPGSGASYVLADGAHLDYGFSLELDLRDHSETYSGKVGVGVETAGGGEISLEFTLASLESLHKPRFGMPTRVQLESGSTTAAIAHDIRITAQGEVISQEGDGVFPAGFGPIGIWIIKPLPAQSIRDDDVWQRQMTLNWSVPENGSIPGWPARFRDKPLSAEVHADYTLLGRTARTITVGEDLEIVVSAEGLPEDTWTISGSGVWIFNTEEGLPEFFKGDYTLVSGRDASGIVDPSAELRITLQEHEPGEATGAAPVGADLASASYPLMDRRQLLKDLSSGNSISVHAALEQLQETEPEGQDENIALALAFLLSDSDRFTRLAAAKALATWGTDESVPALLGALQDDFFLVEMEAMRTLGLLGDERAVEPLLDRLESEEKRAVASAALLDLDGIAETALIDRLNSLDWSLRLELVRILTKIGTEEAVPRLQQLAEEDRNGLVRQAAAEAVEKIQGR
jgi:hypothetical protein